MERERYKEIYIFSVCRCERVYTIIYAYIPKDTLTRTYFFMLFFLRVCTCTHVHVNAHQYIHLCFVSGVS